MITYNDNNNNELNRVSVVKDLCIHFEPTDLSLIFCYIAILNKSYEMLRFINRNTQYLKKISNLKSLYCTIADIWTYNFVWKLIYIL